ncbi:unnamed protein product, partial [Aphanomyces euteiches]
MKIALTIAALAATAQAQVAVWGQCGGTGYSGSTTCAAGSVCFKQNDYYSQCTPSANVPSSNPTTAPSTDPTTKPSSNPTSAPSTSAPSSGGSKIYFGTATDRPSNYGTIVPDNFNMLVSENGMKWDGHERFRGVFDFSSSLSQIAYAKQHNMK